MIVHVAYFGRHGTTNKIAFNTETKRFTNRPNFIEEFWKGRTFVEAKISKDVNTIRDALIDDGYECVDWRMNRNELMKELTAMGYDVEELDVVKNGVVKKGIRVDGMGNVSPIIYAEDYYSAEAASEAIEQAYHYHLPLDVEYVMKTPGAMAERVRIGFQRSSNKQNLVKRDSPFEGIEEYLYVIFDDKGEMSAKLTPEAVAACKGINDYELWERAKRNTFAETTVESMADILGVPTPFGAPNIMVVSNARKMRGASAILDKDALREAGLSGEYFMLPSSVHEVLLVEYDEDTDIDALSEMVRIINGNEVMPEDQLGDTAYRITI